MILLRQWKNTFCKLARAWPIRVSGVCLSQWVFIFSLLLIIGLPTSKDLRGNPQDLSGRNQEPELGRSLDYLKRDWALLRTPQPAAEKGKAVSFRTGKSHKQFDDLIFEAADRYEVDPALVKAIIMAESGYNPKAVSTRGARGLMQLMPGTAKALGVEDCFDPKHNINGGVKYFKKLLDRFDGDVKLGLAAYNAGAAKVWRHKGVPPFRATKYYIEKVFKYYSRFKKEIPGDLGRV